MRRPLALAACFAPLVACGQPAEPVGNAPSPVIVAHVEAFNARDIAAMTALQHPLIEWYGVNGEETKLEIVGRDALTAMMVGYTAANPTSRGTLRDWSVNGDWIAVTETARWQAEDGETRAQSALAVYQMEDGLIRRVWYYPAVRAGGEM